MASPKMESTLWSLAPDDSVAVVVVSSVESWIFTVGSTWFCSGANVWEEVIWPGDEGMYVGDEGMYVGDEGMYVGDEGMYVGDEGMYVGEGDARDGNKLDGEDGAKHWSVV